MHAPMPKPSDEQKSGSEASPVTRSVSNRRELVGGLIAVSLPLLAGYATCSLRDNNPEEQPLSPAEADSGLQITIKHHERRYEGILKHATFSPLGDNPDVKLYIRGFDEEFEVSVPLSVWSKSTVSQGSFISVTVRTPPEGSTEEPEYEISTSPRG